MTCKPWCEADLVTDGHVCASWLVSMEGYNLAVVDNPGEQPTLILHGTAVTGEVQIPAGAAETVVSLLAALGLADLADLFRSGLRWLSEDEKSPPRDAEQSAPAWPFGERLTDGEGHGWLSVAVAPDATTGPALVGLHDFVVRSVREVESAVGPLSKPGTEATR